MNIDALKQSDQIDGIDGHDSPIPSRNHDDLHRWPVAVAVCRIISESPPQWSTRVGLYGPWGSGKTSVLNLVESLAHGQGCIVVRYKAWQMTSQAGLWAGFSAALMDALEQHNQSLSIASKFRRWLFRRGMKLKLGAALSGAGTTGLATQGIIIPKAAADAAARQLDELTGQFLTLDKTRLSKLLQSAKEKRIVVMIDDLDRADPKLLPQTLLTLRELLDWPGFAFILAFDVDMVARSISEYSKAYGEAAQSFLAKIVDFPVFLPDPTKDEQERLVRRAFAVSCPFIVPETVLSALAFLPRNPRALKLFARSLSLLGPVAERHGDGEIDWDRIVHLELLRATHPPSARWLCETLLLDPASASPGVVIGYELDDAQRRATSERVKGQIAEIIQAGNKESQESLDRVVALCDAIVARYRMVSRETRRYEIQLLSHPPCITWREFRLLIEEWGKTAATQSLVVRVEEASERGYTSRAHAAKELIQAAAQHYELQLSAAADAHTDTEKRASLEKARQAHRFLQDIDAGRFGDDAIHEIATPENVAAMLFSARRWANFVHEPTDVALRKMEEELLLRLTERCLDKLRLYDLLQPWHRDIRPAADDANRRDSLTDHVLSVLEVAVCQDVLNSFEHPDALRAMLLRNDSPRAAWLLEAENSPIYRRHARALILALDLASKDPATIGNAFAYLKLLLFDLRRESWVSGDRAQYVRSRADFIVPAWRAACAHPTQYRGHRELIATRERLVAAGIDADSLPIPSWLQLTIAELQSSDANDRP